MTTISLTYEGAGRFVASNAYHARTCEEAFGAGEVLDMASVHGRSLKSHRHYFACINEGWKNLPESMAFEPFAGHPDHLRKHALILTGYRAEPMVFAMESQATALRSKPLLQASIAEYGLITVKGSAVTIHRAKTQSVKGMGNAEFQRSKSDVLDWIAVQIGADRPSLDEAGRQHMNRHNGGPEMESAA